VIGAHGAAALAVMLTRKVKGAAGGAHLRTSEAPHREFASRHVNRANLALLDLTMRVAPIV